jgi:hypothetical protein
MSTSEPSPGKGMREPSKSKPLVVKLMTNMLHRQFHCFKIMNDDRKDFSIENIAK